MSEPKPPAEKPPSWNAKQARLAKVIARNESVFRKLSKSYRRHYKKSHGLR